ncbi:Hypothetical predicted protein [Paramuricea clavata]|uniref:Uncharacterized protein n=1 Tax=Paramuricea clavata TaxID=317549 RepID=A0A6S7LSS6_PARCT|nr:Hypothetical predicted protein [Paramuricea clavata]
MGKSKDKKKDGKSALNDDFITVQRLSAEVSGKAQKYARIGTHVFVPFEFDDLTIDNIKIACLKHFAVDPSMTCDVVAGEQGPSKAWDKTTTKIDIYSFNLDSMTWSSTPCPTDFVIEEEPFGVGGFRKAFKATSSAAEFSKTTWVVKTYLERSIDDIGATNQTVEQHTRKVVQMHYLARNYAARLHQELEQSSVSDVFGETLKYNKVFWGKD